MKKLLVLGIGGAQADVIEVGKEMGLYVYAIARDTNGPGYELADEFIEMDVFDVESINALVREKEIDAVFTAALEPAISVLTEVSKANGLRYFVTENSIEMFKDKGVWREAIGDVEGNLKHQTGLKVEEFEDWTIYPAIVKPADGSGQRGVHRIESYEEMKEVFDDALKQSRKGSVIVEEFAEGEEISINSFMYNGELAFYEISDRISYDEYPGGIIKKHFIPSKHDNPELRVKLENLVKAVSKAMEYENGHVYYQLKIANNDAKIVEFTPRYDACHMWRLVKATNNINLIRASLEYLVYGKSEEIENYKLNKNEGRYKLRFISDKPGTIVDRAKYTVPENIDYLFWYYKDGDTVKKITGYIEKVGYYIIKED